LAGGETLWLVMSGSCSLNEGILVVLVIPLAVPSTVAFGTFFVNGGYAARLSGLSSRTGLATSNTK